MPMFTSIGLALGASAASAAAVGVAATAATVGTAVSTIGSIKSGQAQKSAAYQQADLQDQEAVRARQIAEGDERDYRRSISAMLASRRAGLGAQGVTMAGTPSDVDESIVSEAELQALRIRVGGKTAEATGRQQAALTRTGGKNATTASYYRAGSSLLSGIGDVSSLWAGSAKPVSTAGGYP